MKKKYFLLLVFGILALLLGLLLKLNVLPYIESLKTPFFEALWSVVFEGIIAFGSGLIVAFFSMIVKIPEKIDDLLRNKGKEKIINGLLSSDDELFQYKQNYIMNLLNMDKEYRTNVVYTVNASIKDDKVIVESTLRYEAHFLSQQREAVSVCFDDNNSVVDYIKITNPNNSNDCAIFSKDKLGFKEKSAHGDGKMYEWYCKIPKSLKNFHSLIIEKKYTITGKDHWAVHGIVFQHLLHGLNYTLTLDDKLSVSDISIFENSNVFNKKITPTTVNISASQWLSKFGGISIIISKKT